MTRSKIISENSKNDRSEKFRKITEKFNFSESEKFSEKFSEKYQAYAWIIFIFREKFLRSLFFIGSE